MAAESRWKSPALLLFALFFLIGARSETALQPEAVRAGYLKTTVGDNPGVVVMTDEFRVVVANLLWSKVVDHYHHVYIAQGGDWSRNVTLLPLLHTITELDPHFTQAYELEGGTILPRTGHFKQGEAVLMEGLRNNPDDWEMNREVAMHFAWLLHDPVRALPYAEHGLQCADDGFSRQLLTRLCRTLRDQIQEKSVTASGRPPRAPDAPASAVGAAAHPPATG